MIPSVTNLEKLPHVLQLAICGNDDRSRAHYVAKLHDGETLRFRGAHLDGQEWIRLLGVEPRGEGGARGPFCVRLAAINSVEVVDSPN